MIGNLVHKLLKKNDAPEWFCAEKKRKTPESEIKTKIRSHIESEIVNRNYDMKYWNEDVISRMTNLYYKFFDQLYMQSA